MTYTRTPILVGLGLLLAGSARAGSLAAPASPDDPGSAMYTLEAIHDRLATGAAGALRTTPFAEPAAGPGSTGHSLNDVMGKAPAVDDSQGAAPADVPIGKTFWGLRSGAWGPQTGTLPTEALSPASATVSAGYYAATTLNAVDTDLAAGNIKQGVNLFGVIGTNPPAGSVPRTGQTVSTSATVGEDGDLQKGLAWPSPRFTDNGNGTVTDNLTGLIWLKNANCFWLREWEGALAVANALANGQCGLTDGSTAGQWRLPNVREQSSLIDYGRSNPALPLGHPFAGAMSYGYWTSTSYAPNTTSAYLVRLNSGTVDANGKVPTSTYYVWPVRGGQ